MATVEEKRQELALRQQKVQLGGGEKRIAQQHAKGKQTARERLAQLFDAGTFVELDQFVTHRCVYFGMDQKELPGEGVVTGYGTIEGRLVYAFAQDFTVEGGSLGEMHAAKICKVLDLAMKMGAPVVGINDSGGARIQEAVDAMSGYGQIFRRNTHASGLVPQISVIMGPCAGGAVYSPALTDFIYMVEKESQMFITGPAVIKAVTAEEVTGEQLGGTLTHNAVSGVAHFKAADEADCIAQIRRLLRFLPSNNLDGAPLQETADPDDRMEAQLNLLMPDHPNQPYDMKEVISRIVDDADFYEVHEHFARNIITCFARFGGQAAGIIANQPSVMAGCLDINASDKAARFIRFCDAFNLPVVNLIDVPGFLPGTDQEMCIRDRRRAARQRCRRFRSRARSSSRRRRAARARTSRSAARPVRSQATASTCAPAQARTTRLWRRSTRAMSSRSRSRPSAGIKLSCPTATQPAGSPAGSSGQMNETHQKGTVQAFCTVPFLNDRSVIRKKISGYMAPNRAQ